MVRQGRNEQCRCGSGKKAKFCCGSWRSPSPESLDEAFIATALRETHLALVGVRVSGRAEEYLEELVELPGRFPGLGVELPRLVDLDVEALLHSCSIGDGQGLDEALAKVARRFHTASDTRPAGPGSAAPEGRGRTQPFPRCPGYIRPLSHRGGRPCGSRCAPRRSGKDGPRAYGLGLAHRLVALRPGPSPGWSTS